MTASKQDERRTGDVAARYAAEAELARTRAREDRLLAERNRLSRALEELEAENAHLVTLRDALALAEEELDKARRLAKVHRDILDSLSWRLTRPLRRGIARIRSLRGAHR
ncbi:MAG: hypothetical protein ABSG64_07500 [Solirubrobacteraceae bacterium]